MWDRQAASRARNRNPTNGTCDLEVAVPTHASGGRYGADG